MTLHVNFVCKTYPMIEIVNMEEKNTEPLHKRYLNWDILVYRTFTDAAGMCPRAHGPGRSCQPGSYERAPSACHKHQDISNSSLITRKMASDYGSIITCNTPHMFC